MCGRYVSPDQAAIERHWHIGRRSPNPFDRRFNVAPASRVPILVLDPETGELELLPAIWGLVPAWWKDAKPPRFTFNARSEEAAAKPMWRGPLKSARCLVPAEGWYEWMAVERTDPKSGEIKSVKQPCFIHQSAGIFAFAGIMSQRASDGGEPAASCAILTTRAAPPIAAVHERMPVVLPDAAHREWLNPELNDPAKAAAFARDHAQTDFEYHRVSSAVNAARNDGPTLIARIQERE